VYSSRDLVAQDVSHLNSWRARIIGVHSHAVSVTSQHNVTRKDLRPALASWVVLIHTEL
jgi:hypothetical protein